MDKLYNHISDKVQGLFAETTNGYTREDLSNVAYLLAVDSGISPETFNEATDSIVVQNALEATSEFSDMTEKDAALYEEIYNAEISAQEEFSVEDIETLVEHFSQSEFSESSDFRDDAFNLVNNYITQDEFSWLSKRDSKRISKDLKQLGRELKVLRTPTVKERIKSKLTRKPNSPIGKVWQSSKQVIGSPYGQLVTGVAIHKGQVKAMDKMGNTLNQIGVQSAYNAISVLENQVFSEGPFMDQLLYSDELEYIISNTLFTESEEDTIQRTNEDQERSDEESLQDRPIPENGETSTINDDAPISDIDVSKDLATTAFSYNDYDEDDFDGSEGKKKTGMNYGSGFFLSKSDDKLRPGVLGSGRNARSVVMKAKNAIQGRTSDGKRVSWMNRLGVKTKPSFANVLTDTMMDAITEGLLTGVYYQSLDSGLKVGSGTIARGYDAVEAMMKPTLDKLQTKLETAGSNFSNWLMPDGPSGAAIIDGMDDKDAMEIIKALDSSNWLTKLNDGARTVFLMNLSKSGVCYIDERGTLKKRNIIDKLIQAYREDPDKFFEVLPDYMDQVKELYKTSALVSEASINTDTVYTRLKGATSVEQVQSILNDEFNVMKKPLVSLKDLSISLSNDFISLMKSDKVYFKSLIAKILRSVETMARQQADSELNQMSQAFLRNLAMSANEAEIRRTTDRLIVANVRYLSNMLTDQDAYAEELDIQGANHHMDNSPVKSNHGSSHIAPSHLGVTAGWTHDDQDLGDQIPDTDKTTIVKDAHLKGEEVTFAEEFVPGFEIEGAPQIDMYSVSGNAGSDRVNAPGFGMDAVLNS